VIKLEAIQLQRLTATTLQRLNVTDTVTVREIRELPDGTWLIGFEDHLPNTRFPGFEVYIEQDWSVEEAGRELRWELRKKLWVCPLCQRRGEIRRMVDREVFRVECTQCGRYEIEADLLDYLRRAAEQEDPVVAERLARLSDRTRSEDRLPPLSMDNWENLAEQT
jgi:Zn ribbon nucleic-acid-binding protein